MSKVCCKCPECNSGKFRIDKFKGDEVCADCGLVLSEHLIDSTHPTISIEEMNNLQFLGKKKVPVSYKLRFAFKIEKQLDWTTKSILISSSEIERIGKLMNIPDQVVEFAKSIYKEAKKQKLIVGRSIVGISIASLFYACRFHRFPINMEELVKYAELSLEDLKKCYRKIIIELKLKIPTVDPLIMVTKYASEFNLNQEIQKTSCDLINIYLGVYRTAGNTPNGIIAAAIYMASLIHQEKISQKAIVNTINVSEVTLRSRFKELQKLYMQTISSEPVQKMEILIQNF